MKIFSLTKNQKDRSVLGPALSQVVRGQRYPLGKLTLLMFPAVAS